MELGVYALPTYFPDRHGTVADFYAFTTDFFVAAEAAGFASGWVNEHHFHPYGGMIPVPAVLLAAIAVRTSRIRLGTSVALLPLHRPIELAEAYAMVDQLSGGRLEFGVGRGFVAHDYETMGVAFDEAQERLVEALDVITALWRDRKFPGHHGRFYEVDEVELWPPPLQQPHPPVWAAATSNPASFTHWGRAGVNLLTVLYPRPLVDTHGLIQLWRDAAAEAGHDPGLRVGTHAMVFCDEDRGRAQRIGEQAFASYLSQHASARSGASAATGVGADFAALVETGRLIISDPAGCAAMLRQIAEVVGVDSVDCAFHWGDLDPSAARASFELFAREVVPTVRP